MDLWDINSVYLDIISKCQTTLSRTWPPISQASSTPKASTSQMIRVRKSYPFSSINWYCRSLFTILQILIHDTADSYSRSAPSLSSSVYCITLFICMSLLNHNQEISEKGSHLWPLFDCVKRASWKVNAIFFLAEVNFILSFTAISCNNQSLV